MAAALLATESPIASPCISSCRIDPADAVCTGCGRTLDEIAAWSAATPGWRADVMKALPDRRAAYRERNPAA
ncbi:DUF1289 domain-containing protein [Sphingomonas sp. PvP055]|uniref:DUF1289 domain-containing protein n=1 Tax=Sphingomonas sp. PvP055 TaxID=3156391 RepID=UPI003392DD22